MSAHYIEKCKDCMVVISQCRCPAENKTVKWSECGCVEDWNAFLKNGIETVAGQRREIHRLKGQLNTAQANEGAWEATAQAHYEEAAANKTKAGEMQLIAGRYQYQFEQAMNCINAIDDLFEYRYKACDHNMLQKAVRGFLATFTKAVKPKGK